MPSVTQNIDTWDSAYDWTDQGEEWSRPWGGSEGQWYGSIFPRVQRLLPAPTVLEIAPGYGRWTAYLADHCERLVGIDVSAKCVDVCRSRFQDRPEMAFHVNDGRSLGAVDDRSIDLAFSFDSLVHVEAEVIDDYVNELARVLADDGVAFLHHSNAGECVGQFPGWDTLDADEIARLEVAKTRPRAHWRAMSMTAGRMRDAAQAAGLSCTGQELIAWGGDQLIDCVSVLVRSESARARRTVVKRNHHFAGEMHSIATTVAVYGEQPSADGTPTP